MAIAAWLMPACFVVLPFEQLDRVAVLLRPERVHPQQHLGPIVGVGAAVAGVDREDRAGRVVPAVEQGLELELLDERFERGDFAGHFVGERRILARPFRSSRRGRRCA